ncbi:MAG: ComEA family DNA-binding protein [Pseudomonadota bacterium]|nr:ComEA family DNA-binding protein [Pseudomonadota bacterium]
MKDGIKALVFFAAMLFAAQALGAAVNVNSATAEDIAEALDHIGPKKAEAIVEYRKKHGSFQSIDDLLKVKGIGPGTLDKIRSDVQLKDPK